MAAIDVLGTVTGFGQQAMSIILIVVLGVIIIGSLVGGFIFLQRQKQYRKFKILIFKRKKDAEKGHIPIFVGTDLARIKKDRKTKKWVLHLKKNNVDLGEEEGGKSRDENRQLDLPSMASEQGGECIIVEKLGPRKFAICNPIDIAGTVKVQVSEADIAEANRVYDVNARYFGKDNMQYFVLGTYIIVIIIIFILVIFVLNKFDVLSEVASKLEGTARILAETRQAAVPSDVPG